ncbi:MAG: SDR family oxidoreductase [Spirochaetia bacterium]
MKKGLIVITGASSGIGEALAKLFSAHGHPLLLLARRVERMENLNLPDTLCRKVDILDINSFKIAMDEALSMYGPVQCLINNAGVMLLGGMPEQAVDEWNQMLDVNVKGLLHGVHLVLQSMLDRNDGTIINISSIAGQKTFPNHGVYCGTKFAVRAITESMRQEAANSNVRVIVISPGVVETELLGHTTSDQIKSDYEGWKTTIDGGLQAQNIADAILFAFSQPQNVCIREITIAPTKQVD